MDADFEAFQKRMEQAYQQAKTSGMQYTVVTAEDFVKFYELTMNIANEEGDLASWHNYFLDKQDNNPYE